MTRDHTQPFSFSLILVVCVAACLPELWPEPSETPKQGPVAIAISHGEPPDTVPDFLHRGTTTQEPFEVTVGRVLRLRITGKLETSNIRWTSSDPSIIHLEQAPLSNEAIFTGMLGIYLLYRDELVTAKKPGTVTVFLKVDGQRDSVTVTVRPPTSP